MKHYGWLVSPYTAKTRSYLQYIKVEFVDIAPTTWDLYRKIKPKVGKFIMPTMELDNGTWLQDSSVIIDHFDNQNCFPSIHPQGATQALASYLLEVFADEWLPMAALHYRWNIAGNKSFATDEFARYGFPMLPRFVGRKLVGSIAQRMQSYLPILGVTEKTYAGVEETVSLVLDCLEAVLSEQHYIMGGRPCLGDFSLFAPLWAHLYRDPYSTYLFDGKPNVVRWMKALRSNPVEQGPFLSDDAVPAKLDPLFRCIFVDQWLWIKKLVRHIDVYCERNLQAKRVPRALGFDTFSIRGLVEQRKLITFVQWKAQRAETAYLDANGLADQWLERVLEETDLSAQNCIPTIQNPFELKNFAAVLKKPNSS